MRLHDKGILWMGEDFSSRLSTVAAVVISSFVANAAFPSINPETVVFNQANTRATISYELKDAPAIVTCDIETNTMANASGEWVSIGGENLQTLSGDVHKVVRTGARKITWQSRAEWPDMKIPAGQIRAVVTAWATNAPPDYLVIGLDVENDVRLYAKPDFVPYGIDSDYYKTNAILMRKIPAAGVTWRMGSFEGEDPNRTENEVPHLVMLTADYYMGVYELTQAQLVKIGVENNSTFKDYQDSPMRPAENLIMPGIRGWTGNTYWPAGGYGTLASGSIVRLLRGKCGLDRIDLPTEAQWEYACRAGTTTAFNNGKASSVDSMNEVGWHVNNSGGQTHVVGGKDRNGWGLYDMHGNVSEAVLDRWATAETYQSILVSDYAYHGVTVDPTGPTQTQTADTSRMTAKGGNYTRPYYECRSASRAGPKYNAKSDPVYGCRLCAPAVFK